MTEKSEELRQSHWDRIAAKLDDLEGNNLVTKVDPEVVIRNFWADSEGMKMFLHFVLTLAIFFTGIGSYVLIARNISLSDAVSTGVNVLGSDNVSVYGWICLALFWVLWAIYFHLEILHSLGETAESLQGLCAKKEARVFETVFNTPEWANAQAAQEFDEMIEKKRTETMMLNKK